MECVDNYIIMELLRLNAKWTSDLHNHPCVSHKLQKRPPTFKLGATKNCDGVSNPGHASVLLIKVNCAAFGKPLNKFITETTRNKNRKKSENLFHKCPCIRFATAKYRCSHDNCDRKIHNHNQRN